MPTKVFSHLLEDAITEVLEAMCFISCEGAVPEEAARPGSDWICGQLDFIGDRNGTFGIALSPATATYVAANFLGEEEADLTTRDTTEVVCELTNMMCGTLLAKVDSKKIFTLSPPRPANENVAITAPGRINRTYAIEDGYVRAWVELRASA